MDVTDSEKQLRHQLIDAGVKLLVPPPSTDELLVLLDIAEDLLSKVKQAPSSSIQDGLLPSMKALISDKLIRHPNMDVKVSVISCISEVLRITAPHQPYQDERMKEIFQLILAAFEKLSLLSGRCYFKALHILETVAKIRACVILLDLGCDALITQMFQLLLNTIKFNHPSTVFFDMEEIMTWLIDESDEISLDLLKPLLASLEKKNQIISPISWTLGEKVLKNCSASVKPYLMKAVKSMRLDIHDYADIIASLCQDMPAEENVMVEGAETDASHLVGAVAGLGKSLLDDGTAQEENNDDNKLGDGNSSKTLESCKHIEQLKSMAKISVHPESLESGEELQTKAGVGAVPRIQGRKAKFLTKPQEGYEHSGITGDFISLEITCERKNYEELGSLQKNSSTKKSHLQSEPGKQNNPCSFPPRTSRFHSTCPPISLYQADEGRSPKRRGRPKKKESMVRQDNNVEVLDPKGYFMQRQLKEKSLPDSDGHLSEGSDKTKNAEKKSGRGSKRKKSAVKDNTGTTSGLKNVVVKKENDILSDSEGKPIISLRLKDRKKGMKDKGNAEKHDTEEYLGKGSKKPRVVKEYGEELIGSRIKVWWPIDREFYEGVIESFDPSKQKHKVLYVDGDQEILNLKRERWFLVDNKSIEQDQKPNLPGSAVARVESQIEGRKRGSKYAESSIEDILCIKTQLDALAKDDEETRRRKCLKVASKSSSI